MKAVTTDVWLYLWNSGHTTDGLLLHRDFGNALNSALIVAPNSLALFSASRDVIYQVQTNVPPSESSVGSMRSAAATWKPNTIEIPPGTCLDWAPAIRNPSMSDGDISQFWWHALRCNYVETIAPQGSNYAASLRRRAVLLYRMLGFVSSWDAITPNHLLLHVQSQIMKMEKMNHSRLDPG